MDYSRPPATYPERLVKMGSDPGPTPLVDITEQAIGHTWDLPLDDSFALPSPIESEAASDDDWLWGTDQTVRAMDAQPSETNAASGVGAGVGAGAGAGVGAGVVGVAQWVAECRSRSRYTRSANPHTPIPGNEAFPSAARDHAAVETESQGASSSPSMFPRPGGNVRPPACICTSDLYFHGEVTMQPREQAVDFARAVCEAGSSLGSYALWTGGSFSRSRPAAGHSVASRLRGERWRLRVRRALGEEEGGNVGGVVCAHLRSIEWALEEAVKHVELWPPTEHAASRVRIFTCSMKAVCAIGRLPRCAPRGSVTGTRARARARLDMLETISRLSRRLGEMDAKVELHWVPRSRVPGYVLAMEAAKHASETPRGLGEEEWTLPSESSTDDLDGEAMAEMDEVDAEFEEEIETEVKTEVKTEADVDD